MHYIFGEITQETAERVVKAVVDDGERFITICSGGGDLMAALAIYDAIVENGVTVVGTGMVASAGIVILLGGDKRLATPNVRMMTHGVSVDSSNPSKEEVEEMARLEEILAGIFVERTSLSETPARAMLKAENNFGFDEAVEMGFISGEWKWRDRDRPGF